MPAKKKTLPRLPAIPEQALSSDQSKLIDSIRSGPRGEFKMSGPFFCYLHAPAFGELAQKFGAFCRYKTGVPPRLSEFAILVTAQHWKAAYEWSAHEPQALRAGVKQQTIDSLRKGRLPQKAPKDEQALYRFIKELYRDKNITDATYKSVNKILGDSATVELVGILGYYAMVAMTLDVFRMPVPAPKPPVTEAKGD
jgi:4-carboxymuconolactone decarboxylase